MHITLEGTAPVELLGVIFHLCKNYQMLSVSEINARVHISEA